MLYNLTLVIYCPQVLLVWEKSALIQEGIKAKNCANRSKLVY